MAHRSEGDGAIERAVRDVLDHHALGRPVDVSPRPPEMLDPYTGELSSESRKDLSRRLLGIIWRSAERAETALSSLSDAVLDDMPIRQRMNTARNLTSLCSDAVRAYEGISGERGEQDGEVIAHLWAFVAEHRRRLRNVTRRAASRTEVSGGSGPGGL